MFASGHDFWFLWYVNCIYYMALWNHNSIYIKLYLLYDDEFNLVSIAIIFHEFDLNISIENQWNSKSNNARIYIDASSMILKYISTICQDSMQILILNDKIDIAKVNRLFYSLFGLETNKIIRFCTWRW